MADTGALVDYSGLVKNACGIAVVHIQGFVGLEGRSKRSTAHDMHLHMLFYVDEQLNHVGMLNLDSGSITTRELTDDPHAEMIEMAQDLSTSWIDSLCSLIENDAPIEAFDTILFDRMDQQLWDVFNLLKKTTFIDMIKKNINDLKNDLPWFNYRNHAVSVVEDRFNRKVA